MIVQLRAMSREEIRCLDVQAMENLSIPTSLLMENAGRGAAAWFAELVGAMPPDAGGRPFSLSFGTQSHNIRKGPALPKVLILCGPGNNGGDGAVVARHLDAWGFTVHVIWFAAKSQLHGNAGLQWTILNNSKVDQSTWLDEHPSDTATGFPLLAKLINDAEWLIDGLLGTGLSRPVEAPLLAVIELMNRSGKPILALDLPSGLDSDTGQPMGIAVRAMATATFVAGKLGFSKPGAAEYTGQIAAIDIGLPRSILAPYYAL
jgi:NAD(P)H-hydrate epimerase